MTSPEQRQTIQRSGEEPPWNIEKVEKLAGPYFVAAMTSPGYRRENSVEVDTDYHELAKEGDEILARIVAEWRHEQGRGKAARKNIGDRNFVSAEEMYPVAVALGLSDVLKMSQKERSEFETYIHRGKKGHKRTITEPLEALVAAISRHSGYEAASQFVRENVISPNGAGEKSE